MTTHFQRAAAGIFASIAALSLASCSHDPSNADIVGGMLPDLGGLGLAEVECGASGVLAEVFEAPAAPYVARCWVGSSEVAFTLTAHEIHDAVLTTTGGIDVTDQACPPDVFNSSSGIACRSTYVGVDGDNVLVRVIVVLSDPAGVVASMPADPTTEDIGKALVGAQIEVLVGTEPVPAA